MLNTMGLMKYNVLNLGAADFQFGHEFLEKLRAEIPFPYIASNLIYKGGTPPWASKYIIIEAGGIKVGILGVVPPDDLAHFLTPDQEKVIQAVPPETALNRLIPEVKEKSDLIILLSQLDSRELYTMLESVKGIDFSISAGPQVNLKGLTRPEGTTLLYTGARGKALGFLKVTLDNKRVPRILERKNIQMICSVPDDLEMAELITKHKEVLNKVKMAEEHKELTRGLEMSPEEFMKRYQQEQK